MHLKYMHMNNDYCLGLLHLYTVHLEAWSVLSVALLLFMWLCFVCHYRTVQLTVSNTLVGRIIGRGGSKINSIQVHAHRRLFEHMG